MDALEDAASRCFEWGKKEERGGGEEGRAEHRPPDFLRRVGICRASKVDSPGLSGS